MNYQFLRCFSLLLLTVINLTAAYSYQNLHPNIPNDALTYYNEGQFKNAIDLTKRVDSYKSNAPLLNFIARCHWDNYRYDSAQYYYQLAEINATDNP